MSCLDLSLDFTAKLTDEAKGPTIVNLTNHTYFNLANDKSKTIYDHVLSLDCPVVLPLNGSQIPTGEMMPVSGAGAEGEKEGRKEGGGEEEGDAKDKTSVGALFDFFSKPKTLGEDILRVDGGGRPG